MQGIKAVVTEENEPDFWDNYVLKAFSGAFGQSGVRLYGVKTNVSFCPSYLSNMKLFCVISMEENNSLIALISGFWYWDDI